MCGWVDTLPQLWWSVAAPCTWTLRTLVESLVDTSESSSPSTLIIKSTGSWPLLVSITRATKGEFKYTNFLIPIFQKSR